MTALPAAIVLGIDTPIGLSVVRELGAMNIPVHGIGRTADAIGASSRYVTGTSVRRNGPLASWLPDVIRETGAKALFAISESDLVALSRLDQIIGGCRILTPRAEKLDLVLDKSKTLACARRLDITTPESWQPQARQDFAVMAAARTYPVVVKWADPAAMSGALDDACLPFIKSEFARDARELLTILRRYDRLNAWPLVQQYCPGHGLGQMLYMKDGRATLRFQHRRIHEWPPEGGVSTLCTAEPLDRHREQMTRSEALLTSIGWEGPAMVEYRHDPATGRYWLMEVNGRFWGSLPLARACGAHFAWEGYRREILGDHGDAPAPRAGLRARYMIPETRRLARVFRRSAIADPTFRARPWHDLAAYVLGFLDPRTRYYVFSPLDPGPFIADLKAGMAKLLRRGTHAPERPPLPRSG